MSYYPNEPPAAYTGHGQVDYEKGIPEAKLHEVHDVHTGENTAADVMTIEQHNPLQRKLKGRHMQMIAIGT